MKLRLLDNSVRLRLSIEEVDSLAAGEELSSVLIFPHGEAFGYALEASANRDSATASFNGKTLRFSAPVDELKLWAATDAVTLAYTLSEGSKSMSVKIEKDFQCLAPRDDEDESNLFPHPRSESPDRHD